MLTPDLIAWLDERRIAAHSSRGNQVRIDLATYRRQLEQVHGFAQPREVEQ